MAAVLLIIAPAGWGAFKYFGRPPEKREIVRFFVSLPEGWSLEQRMSPTGAAPNPLVISPDGRRLAFVGASPEGKSQLWIHSLDALASQPLAGTDGAARPFWSPDSRFLGFFAGGKLKKIDVSGGPPVTLCDAADDRGGAWSRDGVIVFAATSTASLQRVSANGGVPTAATALRPGETSHRRPFFLPDGRHFVYWSAAGAASAGMPIYLGSLDSVEGKLLLNADAQNIVYSQGHLLYLRETTLMAQPFDMQRLQLAGEAVPVAEQVQTQANPPTAIFSASENGVLTYQTGTAVSGSQLVWFDRTGKRIGMLGDSAAYSDIDLSPDGKRVSFSIPDQAGRGWDIWIYDLTRNLRTRFTFDAANELNAIWSPDSSRLVFNSNRKGHFDLFQKLSSGAGNDEVLLEDNADKQPTSWSPDGRFILFGRNAGVTTRGDIFVLPFSGDRKPLPFVSTQFGEGGGQFSPDGRWVAYISGESGRDEVYVAPFPGPGGKWQISGEGGNLPRWRSDGSELFYQAADNKLIAVEVNGKGSSFEVGRAKPLFEARRSGARYFYDVSPNGQRFLINTPREQAASTPITAVLNWNTALNK